MRKAQADSCIHNGAVSLDGGIMRGNGLFSLGRCAPPHIYFPVVTPHSQCHSSPRNMHILKIMARKKSKLRDTNDEIEREEETCNKHRKKFNKRRDRCRRFLDEKTPLMQNLELSRFCMNDSSYNTHC